MTESRLLPRTTTVPFRLQVVGIFDTDERCLRVVGVVFTGVALLTDETLDLAQPPQRQHSTAPITEVPGQGQGLGVVLAGLVVLIDEPLGLAQPPQRQDFTRPVTELPGQS